MSSTAAALIGCFLGFAFGGGCAAAVMYTIYLGGYRAAVRDSSSPKEPSRLLEAQRWVKAHPKS